jgi:hypothetical protein
MTRGLAGTVDLGMANEKGGRDGQWIAPIKMRCSDSKADGQEPKYW